MPQGQGGPQIREPVLFVCLSGWRKGAGSRGLTGWAFGFVFCFWMEWRVAIPGVAAGDSCPVPRAGWSELLCSTPPTWAGTVVEARFSWPLPLGCLGGAGLLALLCQRLLPPGAEPYDFQTLRQPPSLPCKSSQGPPASKVWRFFGVCGEGGGPCHLSSSEYC